MTMLSDPVINDVVSVAETLASDVLIEVRNALESEKIQDELLKRIHEAGRAEAVRELVMACLMNAASGVAPTSVCLVPSCRVVGDGRVAKARRQVIRLFNIHTSS